MSKPLTWLLLSCVMGGQGAPRPFLADIGPAPATELVDQSGRPFRLSDLSGKAVVVSFIYTTCGGVCPATVHQLYRVQQSLRDEKLWGQHVQFVSITLDPARDTRDVLRRYAKVYDADLAAWHFLTGPADQVARVVAAWGMWARTNEQGVLDHPSRIFLLDPAGRIREIYSLEYLDPATVVSDVRSLLVDSRTR